MTKKQRDDARKRYTSMDNETGAALLDAIIYGDADAVRGEISNMRDQLDAIEKAVAS